MDSKARKAYYLAQTSRKEMTPKQRRRLQKKENEQLGGGKRK